MGPAIPAHLSKRNEKIIQQMLDQIKEASLGNNSHKIATIIIGYKNQARQVAAKYEAQVNEFTNQIMNGKKDADALHDEAIRRHQESLALVEGIEQAIHDKLEEAKAKHEKEERRRRGYLRTSANQVKLL